MIQNALDAVELKALSADEDYDPRIWIKIDMQSPRVQVIDNGTGMDESAFRFCLAPHTSFKADEDVRGHKGVGATFLAYGFSYTKLQTKTVDGPAMAAVLRQGRDWAQDPRHTVSRPKFEQADFDVSDLEHEESGTSVEIIIRGNAGERPTNLAWQGAYESRTVVRHTKNQDPLGRRIFNDTASCAKGAGDCLFRRTARKLKRLRKQTPVTIIRMIFPA